MEKKKTAGVLRIVMGLLIIAAMVARITIIKSYTVSGILMLIALAFVVLYDLWLYKKPHGNLLKYAMLIFAITSLVSSCTYLTVAPNAYEFVIIVAYAILCYCAGRLNRIEQNKFIFPIIDILLIIKSISIVITFKPDSILSALSNFSAPIIMTTLMIAYFVRYKEHKEAGLIDAPKA